MSIRLTCPSCNATFLTSDDQLGRQVECPKCGAEQAVPSTVLAGAAEGPARTVWVPRNDQPVDDLGPSPRRRRRRALLLLGVLVLLSVGAIVAWPWIRERWRPVPKDPTEVVAHAYLKALAEDDVEAARRLGTIAEPPAIRSYEDVERDPERSATVRGSFAPLAALHARIDADYAFDPKLGRFQPKNALGPAAETLDALHAAKDNPENDKLLEKFNNGSENERLDAAVGLSESLGQVFTKLAEGALSPKKLLPTYAQLVEQSKPPLPPAEEALALDYGAHRETWDALLKRPFLTLRADGPFVLDRAEVVARVRDRLASSGDPPTPLRLTLTRFRLEGIDTGWKVTAAHREGPGQPPPPSPRGAPSPATRYRPTDQPPSQSP